MKINKKYTTGGLIALGLVTLAGIGSVSASAEFERMRGMHGGAHQERQEMMELRLERAVSDGRITQTEADDRYAKMQERRTGREAMHSAIKDNNYSAWLEAAGDRPITEEVTADTFNKVVEAYNLREAGDYSGAREIMKGLGIEKKMHANHGRKGAYRQNFQNQ